MTTERKNLLLFLGFVAAVCLLVPLWVRFEANGALKKIFPGAKVALGGFVLESTPAVGIADIKIVHPGYQILVQKATFDINRRLTLQQTEFWLSKSAPEALEKTKASSAPQKGSSKIAVFFLDRFLLNSDLPQFKTKMSGSLLLNVETQTIRRLELELESLRSGPLQTGKIKVDLREGTPGSLSVESIAVNKLKIADVMAILTPMSDRLKVRPIHGAMLGGQIGGEADIFFSGGFAYELQLQTENTDMNVAVNEFELQEKMSANGKIQGVLVLHGDLTGCQELTASFTSLPGGGDLVIEDKKFLSTIAENTKQPLEIVEAGLKEYHFDKAGCEFFKNDQNLGISVRLDGPKGKRNFEINFHDLFKTGGMTNAQ